MPEPPIGIEPMTYALRVTRSVALHALAAPIARKIALMAPTTLVLPENPFHDPFHASPPGEVADMPGGRKHAATKGMRCSFQALWCAGQARNAVRRHLGKAGRVARTVSIRPG